MAMINYPVRTSKTDEQAELCANCEHPIQTSANNKIIQNTIIAMFSQNKLSIIITTIIIKIILAVIIINLVYIPEHEMMLLSRFVFIYCACSFFPFALRLTRNYIISIIVWVSITLGSTWLFDKFFLSMEGTLIYDVLLMIFLLSAIMNDATKIIRLCKLSFQKHFGIINS